jgi:hypothetical protein
MYKCSLCAAASHLGGLSSLNLGVTVSTLPENSPEKPKIIRKTISVTSVWFPSFPLSAWPLITSAGWCPGTIYSLLASYWRKFPISFTLKRGQVYMKQTGHSIKTSSKEHLIIWRSQPWFNTPSACSIQSNSEHQGLYKYGPHYQGKNRDQITTQEN